MGLTEVEKCLKLFQVQGAVRASNTDSSIATSNNSTSYNMFHSYPWTFKLKADVCIYNLHMYTHTHIYIYKYDVIDVL